MKACNIKLPELLKFSILLLIFDIILYFFVIQKCRFSGDLFVF